MGVHPLFIPLLPFLGSGGHSHLHRRTGETQPGWSVPWRYGIARMAILGGSDKDTPRGLWDRISCTHWRCVVQGDAPTLMKRFELLSILSLGPDCHCSCHRSTHGVGTASGLSSQPGPR